MKSFVTAFYYLASSYIDTRSRKADPLIYSYCSFHLGNERQFCLATGLDWLRKTLATYLTN